MRYVVIPLLLVASASANALVLSAAPSVKIMGEQSLAKRVVLSGPERAASTLTIVRSGGRYYWASRLNRELRLIRSGIYMLLVDLDGGGYIKVADQRGLGKDLRDPTCTDGAPFLEHVNLMMATVTYYGCARSFDP